MNDAVKANMTSGDGKVLGLPVKDNLFAIIYNKDLFEQAGIPSFPKTMTELRDAIARLEAIGVTPFANGYKEWWVQKHIFQHFINAAAPGNTKALVEQFNAGKTTFADHPELMAFFDFIDLTVEHGMPNPLERDVTTEISDFATGRAAIMTGQGAWVEEQIRIVDPNLNIGVAGYPVSENPEDAMIITGADQALRANKDSPVVGEVIEFFNWLYTSDYGKTWFTEVAKVIPPVKGVPYPDLQMPQQMRQIAETEKTGELAIIYSLDRFHQRFGEIMQAYIAGNVTREQAFKDIETAWAQLGAPK
jgi:raffinose/stachyose/melibiose transport system substrate-binding protein